MQLVSSKHNTLMVNYRGVIEEGRFSSLINSVERQIEMNVGKKYSGVIISLEGATYNNASVDDLKNIVKKLDNLSKKIKYSIALIDYSIPLYKYLKKLSQNSQLKLFKNLAAARLFLEPKSYKQDLRVLVYDEDVQNSKKLSKELSKYGYIITIASSVKDFEELVQSKSNDIILTHSAINGNEKLEEDNKKQLSLSKKLIINLPVFMDTAVETLVSFTGLEAEKLSHTIQSFDSTLKRDVVCTLMHFSGDIEGYFALLFPRDIAILAIESLLGEKIDENDNASIMDGVGEFCNVITGSAKTIFLAKEIKVSFELPKTYISPEEIRSRIGTNNGVWINMQLAGKPFYMFITK